MMRNVVCQLMVWILLLLAAISSHALTTIKVCQNKHCCQRYSGKACNLVQTLRQILPPKDDSYTIESSGCLSHCDQGPNIEITSDKTKEVVEHGVDTAYTAAAVLEMNLPDLQVHPTLLAAWNVMELAEKESDVAAKRKKYNSVIRALEKDDALRDSKAMAQALVLRAQLVVDELEAASLLGKSTPTGPSPEIERDLQRAAQLDPQHAKVWRILATFSELTGNAQAAAAALQQWAQHQPQFATKVQSELARLL